MIDKPAPTVCLVPERTEPIHSGKIRHTCEVSLWECWRLSYSPPNIPQSSLPARALGGWTSPPHTPTGLKSAQTGEVTWQGHTAGKWWSKGLNPNNLVCRCSGTPRRLMEGCGREGRGTRGWISAGGLGAAPPHSPAHLAMPRRWLCPLVCWPLVCCCVILQDEGGRP